MSAESPRPTVQVLDKAKYDPTDVERAKRRKQAEQIPQGLRAAIDESLQKRMPAMEPIKTAPVRTTPEPPRLAVRRRSCEWCGEAFEQRGRGRPAKRCPSCRPPRKIRNRG